MKYIPEEHVLIDYLYGNLQGEEKQKVERYLKENPEAERELAAMQKTRETLGKYGDREVIVPDMFNNPEMAKERNLIPYLRTVMSIAAAVILVLLVGYLTNLRISYQDQQLIVRFGGPQVEKSNAVSLEEVAALIRQTSKDNAPQVQNNNNDSLKAELVNMLSKMEQQRNKEIQNKIDQLIAEEKLAMESYVQQLQTKNTELLGQYFQTASLDQRAYVEDVLIDFTKYMDEQRLQDRQFYLNNLVDLKYESDIQQQETEQILTSIMNKVNDIPKENETQNF